MKRTDLELIERYVKGLVSESEKTYVETLFANGENDHDLRQLLENEWSDMSETSVPADEKLKAVLDKIHHVHRNENKLRKRTLIRQLYHYYNKTAAVLLPPLLIAGSFIYFNIQINKAPAAQEPLTESTILAPLGSRVSFTLPDGTKGMLNSGSYLTYPLPFTSKRKINLTGEAWFEVKHDEKHPFIITVGHSEVKVLGTSFNLNAYPTENYVEIVLKNGKIKYTDNHYHQNITMSPSQRLIIKGDKINTSLVDADKYKAWTEGKLVFRGDPMDEVVRRLERWYNVKIVLVDNDLQKYSYRGTFHDDSLEDVIRFLSMTSPIRYEIIPQILRPDGTLTKKQVNIYMKK